MIPCTCPFGFSNLPTALYLHTSAKEVVILFTLQEPTPSRKTYDADKTTCRDIMSFGNAILWLSTLFYFIPKESIEETMYVSNIGSENVCKVRLLSEYCPKGRSTIHIWRQIYRYVFRLIKLILMRSDLSRYLRRSAWRRYSRDSTL